VRRLAALVLAASPAAALDLPAEATRSFEERRALATERIATGPFRDDLPHEVAEGTVTREVWRVDATELTSLALVAPIRAGLEADGWEIVLDCATRGCGGYEFRFEISVLPAPDMFVDLADYRYLSARREGAWLALVASRSRDVGFVQVTRVDPVAMPEAPVTTRSTSNVSAPPAAVSGMTQTLVSRGRAVLPDLEFETGSTELSTAGYASLVELAAFLTATPAVTIALVGHTDAEGGAEGNVAISRRRAEAARQRLIEEHDIAAARVETHGVGFFAPVARNDTAAGRQANRRVEVVITSTE
jgi:OOP family OmpA-OmpF porin